MQWYNEFLTFIIQTFDFISKHQFELTLSTKLANRDYYVCLVRTWLVIIVLIWFTLMNKLQNTELVLMHKKQWQKNGKLILLILIVL